MTASRSVRSVGFVVLAVWLVLGVAAPAGPAAALPGNAERRRLLEDRHRLFRARRLLPDHRQLHVERTGGRRGLLDAARRVFEGRRLHGRRPRAEFFLHRRDSPGDGVHRGHPPAGGDAAPDVQGGVRAGEGPRGFHLAAVLAGPAGRARDVDADPANLGRVPDRAADAEAATKTYARIVDLLTRTHGFTFTEEESEQLKLVYQAFRDYGPEISTRGGGARGTITFADLTGWSVDATGQPQSFLSTDEHYRTSRPCTRRT